MFNNVRNKFNEIKIEAQKRKEEEERIEREKLEREKQRLLAMSEKELLVEILLMIKNISKENASIIDRVEDLESSLSITNSRIDSLNKDNNLF